MSTTDDVQKRERIEKYKEQRRSKLRETYKPENYRSSSQSSLESQSAEESSIQTSRKRKVCFCQTYLVESVQDFLIKSDMKPFMHLVELSIYH